MIPTRLELRNFLAYRAPEPIVFDGIELACLTGANGVGKSSLLDAITWALWGKARARRDDDLIHLGQNDMQVSIDFVQDGLRYRVLRRRSRAGRGSRGALDLMVYDKDDFPRIISEDGARRTQEKINQILRLDYETFVHSAFLQQGRADAFTLKTAAERKRILADILSLEQWTEYEDAVKTRLSGIASQIDIVKHDIKRIDEEIARAPQLADDLDELLSSLAEAQERLSQAEEAYSHAANAAAARRRERENQRELERLIGSRKEDIGAAQAEVQRQEEKIAGYQATIAQRESIEAGFSQLREARESQSAIAQQLARQAELDRRAHQLESALSRKRADLSSEVDVLGERIRGLEAQLAAAESADIEALRAQLLDLQALDKQRDDTAKAVQAMSLRRAALGARKQALTAEGRALNDRLERLAAADGALCPLCGQTLTAEHRADMLAQLTSERDDKREQYRQCSAEIESISLESQKRQAEIDGWALQLKDLPALQQRLGAQAEVARLAEDAKATLPGERRQLNQLETRLASEDFGAEWRRQLEQLEHERAEIGYDPDSHADLRSRLETFANYERQHTQLEFARISLPEAQQIRDDAAARLAAMHAAQQQDQERRQSIASAITELEAQAQTESEQRERVESIRAESQRLNERKIILEQELNAVAAGREALKRLGARLESSQHLQALLNELRAAFGKNGIPALIIETAIPELEAEANDLLARMTDGRMSLRLSTQREKISGGFAETLDIEIADERGTRDYELYSGGEAFRINFALRIALSKLLARRAGAQLQALFIDEGFGSQDEDGRDKLVDAINTIQSDFDLILVITHIDELRDSFPVHLLVEKSAAGSQVTIR
ncbi:MAG: SMC family ATPase [Chloroflexota bacterium]|nr:SMC family ATPase [Chloroflexota bacterium]MDE2910992.1 SMC family ATPase [Chloroflexota bacterium]